MSGPILNRLQARERELGPLAPLDGGKQKRPHHYWRLAHDDHEVAWLLFDKHDAKVNVLALEALEELDTILDGFEKEMPKGLVIRSAKDAGFCAGADINEFRGLDDSEEVAEKLSRAHEVADRLAALPCPSVAVIHGSCLGGGLELALCCDHRLALPDASLGLPEVRLGLHPGLGGTARLTHLIDPLAAMTMMLTGSSRTARQARSLGLVDAVLEERHVLAAVAAAIDGKIDGRSTALKNRLLSSKPARKLEARQMRSKSADKAPPEHYPAPGALIDLWEEYGGDAETMRRHEIHSFAELLTTDTAQSLLRVFFMREKMKRIARDADRDIAHVHVIGAGAMGGDIAAWCAYRGLRVTLFDPDREALGKAVARASKLCERKHRTAAQTRDILDRLIPDPDQYGVAHADLVIEAVPEKIELKRKVYAEVEPRLKKGALLATNTSSIPLAELADTLKDPKRFIGLHFFNPVAQMQLVEVVEHKAAAKNTVAAARAFVGRIDRLPVPVTSSPGFLVNRALMPYLIEAIVLLDEGVAPETIDRAAEDFGMPMGPVELADQVGLDICLDVAEMLRERLDTPLAELPDWFRKQVDDGELGRKTGKGFYTWKDGKPQKDDADEEPDAEVLDRLLLPMLNTCMTCLCEGVVDDEELLDGAMIFGTGFAPFRGGPLHYANSRGYAEIAQRLAELAEQHGERFAPDAGWTGDA